MHLGGHRLAGAALAGEQRADAEARALIRRPKPQSLVDRAAVPHLRDDLAQQPLRVSAAARGRPRWRAARCAAPASSSRGRVRSRQASQRRCRQARRRLGPARVAARRAISRQVEAELRGQPARPRRPPLRSAARRSAVSATRSRCSLGGRRRDIDEHGAESASRASGSRALTKTTPSDRTASASEPIERVALSRRPPSRRAHRRAARAAAAPPRAARGATARRARRAGAGRRRRRGGSRLAARAARRPPRPRASLAVGVDAEQQRHRRGDAAGARPAAPTIASAMRLLRGGSGLARPSRPAISTRPAARRARSVP